MSGIPFIDGEFPVIFPEPMDTQGLLAVGGGLGPEFLLSAYWQGVFPWYEPDDEILWWSPDPRFVLFPGDLHVQRRLERRIRRGEFEFRVNSDFNQLIRACASTPRPGQDGTWIGPDMVEAYQQLHRLGYAHSFESWRDGKLCGGLYGILVGSLFCGESMFTHCPDASKYAFVSAMRLLFDAGCQLVDCQMETGHLASFGAKNIPREEFLSLLHAYRCKDLKILP